MLIGEILSRRMIAEELGISIGCIEFEKNKYGKPYLKYFLKLDFNISHSGDFVVCAMDNNPIGIDVEKIKYIEYEKIAKEFFSLSEFDYITKKDSDDCLNKFYEIWTLKESYTKCCGHGLSIPLKSFSMDKDKIGNVKVTCDGKYSLHKFKTFDIGLQYKVAVCSLSKEINNRITMIDQNDLINSYLKCV